MIHDSPFDSAHYDLRIGRIDDAEQVEPVLAEARERRLDVVFLRVARGSPITDELTRRGIAPRETLVTSTWRPQPRPRGTDVAISHQQTLDEADADVIAGITAASITNSHFHADPRLPTNRTRGLYAAWAKNDARGRAHKTIVARDGDDILGYIAVLLVGQVAVIDLIAVTPSCHGRGIGSALLASFLDWAEAEQLGARVGTQSDNPALGLYTRFGFVPTDYRVTYHLWLV